MAIQRMAQPTPGCALVYTHGHVEVVRVRNYHMSTPQT